MGFDGIPKPAQYSPTGPLNPYLADHAAKAERAKKPQVRRQENDENVTATHKELPHYGDEQENHARHELTEEEYEQIMTFAKMRGIMNLAFEQGEKYHFNVNPQTGLVDIIAERTGHIVLSITPLELMEMTQRIHRYAGVLTDRSG
jgi:uncharacterized FlaG/YvyC family protein